VTDVERIMDKLDAIHRDVGQTNGRLDEHTAQDSRHFKEIEDRLSGLVIDDAVAKVAAKKGGGAAGRNWGALVAGLGIAIAEAVKAALK
jgi:hypothetical protein